MYLNRLLPFLDKGRLQTKTNGIHLEPKQGLQVPNHSIRGRLDCEIQQADYPILRPLLVHFCTALRHRLNLSDLRHYLHRHHLESDQVRYL